MKPACKESEKLGTETPEIRIYLVGNIKRGFLYISPEGFEVRSFLVPARIIPTNVTLQKAKTSLFYEVRDGWVNTWRAVVRAF